ncbi:MAG: DUF2148 domain-containing protein [Clostridiales Family XIII bacterium]|jgi:uncharacterized ferredoxin-like protein|nr:DUF2148 domain-containing protein [Clostridiales Family XIII bacterium]
MIYKSEDIEKDTVLAVAKGMATAARTAPKGCGNDKIVTLIVDGKEKDAITAEMRKIAESPDAGPFLRDGGNVDNSECVVLIGVRNVPLGLSGCGICGFETCAEMSKAGANCAFNITDLGIAVGSAVSLAADNRIDNRIMYTAGKAAVRIGLLPEDVRVCYAVPLSARGKSVYYDRGGEI